MLPAEHAGAATSRFTWVDPHPDRRFVHRHRTTSLYSLFFAETSSYRDTRSKQGDSREVEFITPTRVDHRPSSLR